MSSTLPPLLPSAASAAAAARPTGEAAPRFLGPMAKSILVMCIVSAVCWAGCVVLALLLHHSAWLQEQLHGADLSWVPPSLRWFGRHAVAVNVGLFALCVAGAVACWGLLRRQRWALWSFIVLLVLTALLNFVGVWVIDEIFRYLIVHLPGHMDPADADQVRNDLRVQRVLYTGITVATALSFAGLHGWLVVRLMRPDVQRWFGR